MLPVPTPTCEAFSPVLPSRTLSVGLFTERSTVRPGATAPPAPPLRVLSTTAPPATRTPDAARPLPMNSLRFSLLIKRSLRRPSTPSTRQKPAHLNLDGRILPAVEKVKPRPPPV